MNYVARGDNGLDWLSGSELRAGYSLTGTRSNSLGEATCRLANPLMLTSWIPSGSKVHVTPDMVGVGAQLAFVFGRSFPIEQGVVTQLNDVLDAVASCRVALQIALAPKVGVRGENAQNAVLFVEGPAIVSWRDRLVPDHPALVRVDGHIISSGKLGDVMGDPSRALLWLAASLAKEDRWIDAGDIIATGSCTGLAQMLPGHVVTGDFGDLGTVALTLT